MVAILIKNFKKVPVIGKVLKVEDELFQLHYWEGSYLKPRKPQLLRTKEKSDLMDRLIT